MPVADYAHHNEDAERIWWEEEGHHGLGDFDSGDPQDEPYPEDDPNDGPLADAETIAQAIYKQLCFDSTSLHSPTNPRNRTGNYTITIEDRFGEGNAFAEITVEITVEGRA